MKNAAIATALLICFTISSFAADLSSASGTYINKRDKTQFITFYPDATFHLKQRKQPPDVENPFIELSGKYELNGETVKFILQDGGTGTGQLKANAFMDGQGDIWVKQGTDDQGVQRPKRHKYF
ncbi:MAG: hypothetical protein ABSE08_05265 [Syntrophobacteraceae bacterium]|jgi:hypothetical protein